MHTPQPSAEETTANRAFHAVMMALARPGSLHDCGAEAQSAILTALVDMECTAHVPPALAPLLRRSGGRMGDFETADFVFLDRLDSAAPLSSLNRGSDLYPDRAALLILGADLAGGAPVRLSGPGIHGTTTVRIGRLPDGFWTTRAQCIRYPMGIDILLTDGTLVLGLPRSTQTELL